MKKIHLGCGQNYLIGYENIDFPIKNHSVQKTSVADRYIDILKLHYKSNSLDEIRLHHVFEHFERSVAFGLLVSWNKWLKLGGVLRIEIPDFYRNSLVLLNPLTGIQNKLKAERHLFGSQEAFWAIHYEGYTAQTIKFVLEKYGFCIKNIKIVKWTTLYNLDVTAIKVSELTDPVKIGKELLKMYLVNSSISETDLLNVWLSKYEKQIQNGKK